MLKEWIADLTIYTLIVFASLTIGLSVPYALGYGTKAYAPTIPPQADPFFEDITA